MRRFQGEGVEEEDLGASQPWGEPEEAAGDGEPSELRGALDLDPWPSGLLAELPSFQGEPGAVGEGAGACEERDQAFLLACEGIRLSFQTAASFLLAWVGLDQAFGWAEEEAGSGCGAEGEVDSEAFLYALGDLRDLLFRSRRVLSSGGELPSSLLEDCPASCEASSFLPVPSSREEPSSFS